MTGRDRIVAISLGTLAVLAAMWLLVISPKRQEASKLGGEVAAAQSQLSTAEGQLASARSAEAQYSKAYAAIVSLGKAVPASDEVPSLIYQLSQASNNKKVEFASISTTTTGSSSSSAAAASPTAAAAAAFTQMPFTFVFNGSFFDLEHLFGQLNGFTVRKASGSLQVSGRLLTVQSVKLAPLGSSAGSKGATTLAGSITATAYVLAGGATLTGGASAASPAGSSSAGTISGASSSPTAPAIARVTP